MTLGCGVLVLSFFTDNRTLLSMIVGLPVAGVLVSCFCADFISFGDSHWQRIVVCLEEFPRKTAITVGIAFGAISSAAAVLLVLAAIAFGIQAIKWGWSKWPTLSVISVVVLPSFFIGSGVLLRKTDEMLTARRNRLRVRRD